MKPHKASRKLSSDEIQIVTQDAFALEPERAPSFAALLQVQEARSQAAVNGLGAFPVVLVAIAGIVVGVSVAVAAVMSYLKTSAVQESNSKQVALQAEAYANYTSAKLECYKTCTGQGGKTEACVAKCDALVEKPDIKLPGQGKPWGWLQWTGFTVVVGVGALIAVRAYQRRREGRPIFELPSFPS
jgi:hypothetical protein